jgi:hypothetical protein
MLTTMVEYTTFYRYCKLGIFTRKMHEFSPDKYWQILVRGVITTGLMLYLADSHTFNKG